MWLTDTDANNVVRVDPSGLLTPIAVGDAPTGIAVGAGGVWVVDSLDEARRADRPGHAGGDGRRSPWGGHPPALPSARGRCGSPTAATAPSPAINPTTDKPATIAVGGSPQAITIADGKAWVTVDEQSIAPSRGAPDGGTLRIVSSSDVPTMDPALARAILQLLYATCAQLLNYPDKAGLAGSQLTPEVAQSLPARSPDGRTYTFKIRPGFRFSPPSNEPVTAQTFKDTIERTLNPGMHSYYAHFLADIVGAGAYMAGKASHIAGVIARRRHLDDPPPRPGPRFSRPHLAVRRLLCGPIGHPHQPQRRARDPIRRPLLRHVVHARPRGRADAQPQLPRTAARTTSRGSSSPSGSPLSGRSAKSKPALADYTTVGSRWSASAARAAHASRLAARYGAGSAAAARGAQQYFVNPAAQLDYFVLNTHRPLFSDVRMRQAVNYAIDRRALAQRGDRFSPLPAHPTDHYLPPGMPGFRDAHVYPMTPDVAKARKLARGGEQNSRALHLRLLSVPGAGPDRQDRPAPRSASKSRSRPSHTTRISRRWANPAIRSTSPGTAGYPTTSTPRRC